MKVFLQSDGTGRDTCNGKAKQIALDQKSVNDTPMQRNIPKSPKSKSSSGQYVPHPRYGSSPRPSGVKVSESELRRGLWGLSNKLIFPETALIANTTLQNFAVYPRKYYVDILKECRQCHRPFIFFAREQRYWFETLKFYVDADCVHCPKCRRESRVLQRRLRRYSDLFAKKDITRKELMFLVDDARHLLERGVLKNLSNLGSVKNKAMKEIPEYQGVLELAEAIKAAKLAQDPIPDDAQAPTEK